MKFSDIPGSKFPIPFANNAAPTYIRPIPEASQIGIQDGAASLYDGFVPDNFLPEAAGGVPPFGQDFNGLMNQSTAWTRWANAGAPVGYDATFSGDIGGYPAGAILATALADGTFWVSTTDDNATNPDSGGAGWLRFAPGKQPTRQQFTSGSGTYTTPVGCIRIIVTMVAGGGGGGGVGAAGAGSASSFNSVTAGPGGGGGDISSVTGGTRGSGGVGVATYRFPGGSGQRGIAAGSSGNYPGGQGGASLFGGAGASDTAGAANSGSGGGGSVGALSSGGGGGGGETVIIVINNPAASYPYTVGAGGAAGSGGGSAGGSGRIMIEEFYN